MNTVKGNVEYVIKRGFYSSLKCVLGPWLEGVPPADFRLRTNQNRLWCRAGFCISATTNAFVVYRTPAPDGEQYSIHADARSGSP